MRQPAAEEMEAKSLVNMPCSSRMGVPSHLQKARPLLLHIVPCTQSIAKEGRCFGSHSFQRKWLLSRQEATIEERIENRMKFIWSHT